MFRKIAFVLAFAYPSLVLAEVCPTTLILKGQPMPCDGYVLSVGAISEAAKLPKQISLLEEKLSLKDNKISLLEEKVLIYVNLADKKDVTISDLQKSLLDKDKNEQLKLGLAVGGTVVATALLAIALAFAFGKISIQR